MALSELFQDLDPKLAEALSQATDALRKEFDQKLGSTRQELGLESPAPASEDVTAVTVAEAQPPTPTAPAEPPAAQLDSIAELKHAVAEVDRAGSQGEILGSLVAGCSRFASRSAVFLMRGGQVSGWNSHGFAVSDDDFRAQRFEIEDASPWDLLSRDAGAVALTGEECAAITVRLGGEAPEMGILIPFVLGNQTAAGIYCDRVTGDGGPEIAALQLLAFTASQVLENLPVRDRASTSTLRLADSGATAAVAAPAIPAPVEDLEVEEVGVEEAGEVEEPGGPPAARETDELEKAEEADVSDDFEEPEAPLDLGEPEEAERLEQPEASEELAAADSYEPAGPAAAQPTVEELPSLEPEEADSTTIDEPEAPAAHYEPEPVVDDAAVEPKSLSMLPPSAEPEPIEPEPSPTDQPPYESVPGEPEPPNILSGATTQVAPPEDLEGPGWAFTGSRTPAAEGGDEAQHEEARRLARLLVTEVKLYNEEMVEQGRQQGNVYAVLKEDIDRSRQIFEDRIDEDVRGHNDYFQEALVRILAGGDPSLLGA